MAEFPKDPAALAQRYWGMWADALRDGSAGFNFDPGKQGLDDALGLWSRQAGWGGGFGDVLERFRDQCGDWYGRMQQVAAQFSGQDHSARDVAEAWRSTFAGGHPFDGLMQGLQGPGLENLARWSEAAMPWLDGVRAQATAALGMPAFGFTREHQEREEAQERADKVAAGIFGIEHRQEKNGDIDGENRRGGQVIVPPAAPGNDCQHHRKAKVSKQDLKPEHIRTRGLHRIEPQGDREDHCHDEAAQGDNPPRAVFEQA